MAQKEPIYILIPVHNRKQLTLRCLATLSQNGDRERYYIVVVDDGSIDGTADAIHAMYSDVTVLQGDGSLWWTGAIAKGMQYAYEQGADCFVWLNDDTLPTDGAITALATACRQYPRRIVTGQCYSAADFRVPTYGGQHKAMLRMVPLYALSNKSIPCDVVNGNMVCLPRSIVECIGYPSQTLPHYGSDTIYTWKAKQFGFVLEILGQVTAVCEHNPGDSSWLLSDIPIPQRWQSLRSPKSPFYVPGYWNFCTTLWGAMGILVFIQPYLRLLLISILRWTLPLPVLKFLKAHLQSLKLTVNPK